MIPLRRITIDAQCNGIGGTVEVGPDTLTISQLVSTKMYCDDPRGAMESLLTEVFNGRVDYVIEQNRLTVTRTDGTGLVFVAEHSAASTAAGFR